MIKSHILRLDYDCKKKLHFYDRRQIFAKMCFIDTIAIIVGTQDK